MTEELSLDSIGEVRLYQRRNGHRFTIDSVLLADFVRRVKPKEIIDIGAGNGVIGLLLAARYPGAHVTLLEIQDPLCRLCDQNAALNGFGKRVSVLRADVTAARSIPDLRDGQFDLAVSNPPFRVRNTGRISPFPEKAIARHEIHMNLEALLIAVRYLLRPRGSVCLVCHPFRLVEVFEEMRKNRLEPKRIRFIHPRAGKESNMVLVEGIRDAKPSVRIEPPLFLYNRNHEYTDEVLHIIGR